MSDLYSYQGWSKDAVIAMSLRQVPSKFTDKEKATWIATSILRWADDNDIDLDEWDDWDVMQEARKLVTT